MLKKNILATNLVFTCIDHNDEHLDNYFDHLEKIFKIIKDCENEILLIDDLLEGACLP